MNTKIRVLVTGSQGFLGANLVCSLKQNNNIQIIPISRENYHKLDSKLLSDVNYIFHLAGVNRPRSLNQFEQGNSLLTKEICRKIESSFPYRTNKLTIIYSSSIQVDLDNPYGQSKLRAEESLIKLSQKFNIPLYIYRLSNLFGKWSKPDYNSVVATFCHNIARGLPIKINDPKTEVELTYIDDVISEFVNLINNEGNDYDIKPIKYIESTYKISLDDLSSKITKYHKSRKLLKIEEVANGFNRKLYATYLAYLQPKDFSYNVPKYVDERGDFVEFLKTNNSGQFSYFTANPGVVRGNHYHHTKNEKFFVIKGVAKFTFTNINTLEKYELVASNEESQVIDSIPGWAHSVKNIGEDELIVLLWCNEVFDREKPDTYPYSNQ